MIDVAGNHHYLAAQQGAAGSDASLCLPPSYISADYFVHPAAGCFTPKSDSLTSTTYEMSFFSHDSRPRPLHAQRHLSKPPAPTFGSSPPHTCETISNTVILDGDARIVHLCSCDAATSTTSSTADNDKGSPEDKAKKRQAQNRAAQRAFRQRKERKVKDLEERAAELEKTTKETILENQRRRHRIRDLFIENQVLRAALTTENQNHPRARVPSSTILSRLDAASTSRSQVSELKAGDGVGEEGTLRLCDSNDAPSAGYLPWWNKYRLMLSEENIVGQLKKLDSAKDDLLL